MVNVGEKPITTRRAVAEGFVIMAPATLRAIRKGTVPKGEVLSTARIAGIMAAKRCAELIPLCHSLALDSVEVDFSFPVGRAMSNAKMARIAIRATATIHGKTGVEMEALSAVAVAALTIYDMCKAIYKMMSIDSVRLLEKTGGTSDHSTRAV